MFSKAKSLSCECTSDEEFLARVGHRRHCERNSRPMKYLLILLHCSQDQVFWLSFEVQLLSCSMEENSPFRPVSTVSTDVSPFVMNTLLTFRSTLRQVTERST